MRLHRLYLLLVLILTLCLVLAACSATAPSAPSPSPAAVTSNASLQVSAAPSTLPSPKAPLTFENPKKYSITYTVTINNTAFSPSDIRLYLPLPAEWESQRNLKIGEISPKPESQETEKSSGNSMLYWRLKGTPKKNATAEFVLHFDLTAYETNTNIDPASVLPYKQDSAEVQHFTRPEKYIESDDPTIIGLADTLTKDQTNPYLMAKAYYDYIIDHVTYKLLGQGLNGAKYLLDHKNGECGDYSALFIALCRAKGIPARPIVGYWAISGKDQTHVWAEFFLEGIGWIPVDATIGQQSSEKRQYYFGNMDNQRVILSKGYNTPLVPQGPDGFVAPILQVPMWWYWGSGDTQSLSMDRDWAVMENK